MFALLIAVSMAPSPEALGGRATLSGLVLDEAGRPVSGAKVVIRNARVSNAAGVLGSAYPECGKRATADANGRFALNGLSPSLRYDILILAKDYAPIYSEYLAPREISAKFTLKSQAKRLAQGSVLRGTVIDANGRPVAGATVRTNGLKTGENSLRLGALRGVDRLAVTDEQGSFALGVTDKEIPILLFVHALQMAPLQTGPLLAGETQHELKLGRGVTLKGTVLKDGKPVTGITLLLADKPPQLSPPSLRFETAPNIQGEFRFENVSPDRTYVLFGPMNTCYRYGVLTPRTVPVDQSGTTQDLGSLVMESGYRLSGKLVLADGGKMPGKTTASIRKVHQDLRISEAQTTDVAADGTFRFGGLATDHATFQVEAPGYHISPRNGSYNLLFNHDQLIGSVDRDINGLRILLEPGPAPKERSLANLPREERIKLNREHVRRLETPFQGIPDDK
ncbi:MAG TPA: carboxypeptidase regulatory-like domain-containing protein [Gemmataceae bacterium]|nr:carboxypeptidase regulatory-like domain-containing protein [Gemmataceae bacterium]